MITTSAIWCTFLILSTVDAARRPARQADTTSANVSGPQNNEMYLNTRSNSRYHVANFDTSESVRTDTYAQDDEPYRFSYMVDDQSRNMQFRTEQRMPDGEVRGSYGFKDANGIYRLVEYIADSRGFHAKIHSNEPGVRPTKAHRQQSSRIAHRQPSNVQWQFDQEPNMHAYFGSRRAQPYINPNSYENDDSYRTAASHLQPTPELLNLSLQRKQGDAPLNQLQPIARSFTQTRAPERTLSPLPPPSSTSSGILYNVASVPPSSGIRKRTTLRKVMRTAAPRIRTTDGVSRSAEQLNFGKLKTQPIESIETADPKPVFSAERSTLANGKESVVTTTITPTSPTELNLAEFSQRFPDKWQRILVGKKPTELNVFGDKIPGDRLAGLELENGLFPSKLQRFLSEPFHAPLPLAPSSHSARSVDSKPNRPTITKRSEWNTSKDSKGPTASSYVPPLQSKPTDSLLTAGSGPFKSTIPMSSTLPTQPTETVTSVSVSSSVSIVSPKNTSFSTSSMSPNLTLIENLSEKDIITSTLSSLSMNASTVSNITTESESTIAKVTKQLTK